MKLTLFIILSLHFFINAHSQGITLLYKGGGSGGWNDSLNWIQINTPVGQTPIQRAPTELDDVVFSSLQSGLSTVAIDFGIGNQSDPLEVGGSSSTTYQCRSMHVSNTELSLEIGSLVDILTIDVYTTNGGFVLIDSGSNFRYGQFQLHGGVPSITDLEIMNGTFGSLFSHNNWSIIGLDPPGRARLVNSTLGGLGLGFGGGAGGELYAENCKFVTTGFSLADYSTDTLLNCQIVNDVDNVGLTFFIGRNSNFVSENVTVTSFSELDFTTSGLVLNGDVSTVNEGYCSFDQEDPLHPLPNIINGNLDVSENNEFPIDGDVKISGNFNNWSAPQDYYLDTATIMINNQKIFIIGGLPNYGKTDSIIGCGQNYCHFKMEFFGNTNSNIYWPIGMPIDTLVINKTGCAKATFTNSLYVSGQAKIESGQLVLNPNDTIPYKFVCAGDVNIYQGGGIFLQRDSTGVVANMAVAGAINDYNSLADSACTGLSNPYNGNITLYREVQNDGNHLINITSASNIGNLNLIGQTGSDFTLGGNLTVNNINFINPGKLLLGDHNLIVNGNISNYGINNYFVTSGLGYLQVNNIGSTATLFAVGATSSSYTPARLTNFGTADNFTINVQPRVLSNGTNGNPYIAGGCKQNMEHR